MTGSSAVWWNAWSLELDNGLNSDSTTYWQAWFIFGKLLFLLEPQLPHWCPGNKVLPQILPVLLNGITSIKSSTQPDVQKGPVPFCISSECTCLMNEWVLMRQPRQTKCKWLMSAPAVERSQRRRLGWEGWSLVPPAFPDNLTWFLPHPHLPMKPKWQMHEILRWSLGLAWVICCPESTAIWGMRSPGVGMATWLRHGITSSVPWDVIYVDFRVMEKNIRVI